MIWSLVATLFFLGAGVLFLSASTVPSKPIRIRIWYFFCGVVEFGCAGSWLWILLQGFCGS